MPEIQTILSEKRKEKLRRKFVVRLIEEKDKEFWFACWKDYVPNETQRPTQDILVHSWTKLLNEGSQTKGFIIEDIQTKQPIGFAHAIYHDSIWRKNRNCYMEDAYILPKYRRSGAFFLLYEYVLSSIQKADIQKIYWMTKKENISARKFYNRIATETDWIRYELKG